jgi:hypothetical protein
MYREDPNVAARRHTIESYFIGRSGVAGFAAGMVGFALLLVGLMFSNRFGGPLHVALRMLALVVAIGVPAALLWLPARIARRFRGRS